MNRSRRHPRRIAAVALLATLFVSATAIAQDKKELDVTTLIKQGITAAQEGRWEEAKDRFETAWLKSNAYDVAANLALVEEHFGNYPRAAELFAFALNTFPPGEPPEKRAQLQQKLEEMRPKVAALDIQVDVAACAVTVNGKVIGKTPITGEIFGTPGKQILTFEKKGYHSETREIDVPAGKKETIVIRLTALPVEKHSEPLPMWPAAVGFGLAGAGALLGGGMLIASAVRSGDASDFAQSCSDQNDFPRCADEGQAIVDDVDTFRTVSIVGFVTAGAALAFAIPYTIAAASSGDAEPDDVAVLPVIAPDFQGVFVRSQF